MFTMAKVKDDNKTGNNFMFEHLSCNDYYSENEKVVGYWHGKLAEEFGIKGHEIAAEEFVKIQKNENPWTGGKLTPAVRKGSSRFFDFQCSAQKSVSIMAVVMNDHRLSKAHSECVKEALSEMEKFVSCRIRKGAFHNTEKLEVTASLIAGLYNHDASRALDPQIHTHCVVANVTWCESEQRYKALSEFEILKAIRYCGKFYQNAMAKRIQELGYEIELKRTDRGIEGFEIKGVDNDLLERYSRRRAEIEQKIEEFKSETGREPTPAEIHIIAQETREAKLTEITTPEVLESQRQMLSEKELSHLRSIKYKALENDRVMKQISPGKIIQIFSKTIDHLYERKSVVAGHELLAEALNQGMKDVSAENLKQALKNSKELIPLTEAKDPLQIFYITKRGLALEREAIQLANADIGIFKPLGNIDDIDTSDLSDVQQNAVQGILECQDFACMLRGYAGSGKTTALRPVHTGLIAANKNPLYLAPTRGAVKVLKDDGFENATTVASFLNNPEIEKDTVLIIDESSLVSANVGHKLMWLAKGNSARIIFVGDRRQHLSVEAGDFLKVLEFYSDIKNFELSQIIRQIPKHYRKAVQLMANNKTAEGLERLNDLGVVEEKSHHYLSAAAKRYVNTINDGKKCLLVSPTHREIDTLNALVRKEFSDEGILDLNDQQSRTCFQDHNWTREQIASHQTYRPGNAIRFNTPLFGTDYQKHDILIIERIEPNGDLRFTNGDKMSPKKINKKISVGLMKSLDLTPGDKILITANNQDYGLTNGDTATIEEISTDGEILLDDGRTVPADFESISYGYATTSHKSQGSTCDHAILAAAQMSNRACYVGSSRGRQSVKVFTPDFEHLYDSVKRNSEHLTGHDLIAARQEHINDISPKNNIEKSPSNEEFQQEKESQEFTLSF
jgi:conjugative relaxase-like TrwC/TraI family protein